MKNYLFLFMGILLLYWHTCYGQSSTDIQSYITQYKEIALEQEQHTAYRHPLLWHKVF